MHHRLKRRKKKLTDELAYIYLISKKDNNENVYKIGFTRKDPRKLKRLKQLQTGNEEDLVLVDYYESRFAKVIENAMHNSNRSRHKRGEWFYLDDDFVNSFRDKCKAMEKNFEILSKDNYYFKKNMTYEE